MSRFFRTLKNVPKIVFLPFSSHVFISLLHYFFIKTFPMGFRFGLMMAERKQN